MKNLTIKSRVLLKYACIATFTYILYFLIMKIAGLAHIPEFRFVNYFLYFFVTYYALYDFIKVRKHGMEYLEGMSFTFLLGAASFLMFGLFVLMYSLFSPFFIEIVGREMPASQLGIFGPTFIVCAEGFGISSVVSLCMMQYFQAFSSRRQLFLYHGKKFFERQERETDARRLATNHF